MVTHKDFIQRLKSQNHLVQHSKQYHREVLLSGFRLNEQSHLRISGKYCSAAFILVVTHQVFIHRLKSYNHLAQYDKQYHSEVLLSSLHTPQIYKLKPHNNINNTTGKYCSVPFIQPSHFFKVFYQLIPKQNHLTIFVQRNSLESLTDHGTYRITWVMLQQQQQREVKEQELLKSMNSLHWRRQRLFY